MSFKSFELTNFYEKSQISTAFIFFFFDDSLHLMFLSIFGFSFNFIFLFFKLFSALFRTVLFYFFFLIILLKILFVFIKIYILFFYIFFAFYNWLFIYNYYINFVWSVNIYNLHKDFYYLSEKNLSSTTYYRYSILLAYILLYFSLPFL